MSRNVKHKENNMTKIDEQRVPCAKCGAMILPTTAKRCGGICARCKREEEWAKEDKLRRKDRDASPPPPIPTPMKKYPAIPYKKWATDPNFRWVDVGHTFGTHLMKYVRDEALNTIPENATDETRQCASEAIRHSIYAMMALFDGIHKLEIGSNNTIEYVLQAVIRDEKYNKKEMIELAPNGDGLCMGFAGWWENDFWRS